MKNKPADIRMLGCDQTRIINANPKLNERSLKLLKEWITERYTIHIKKDIENLPAPWTTNKILKTVKFTNVRREHDRATKWLISNVCRNYELSLQTKITNCILFRLYNKWETCDLFMPINFEQPKNQNGKFVDIGREFLTEYEKENPEYVFYTSAFNTGGMKKHAGILTNEEHIPTRPLALIEWMFRNGIIENIIKAGTPIEVCDAIMEVKGIGEFLSYQMFVDFTYIEEYPFSENEFTIAGPGCMVGLDHLFEDYDGMTHEEALFWLREYQCEVFSDINFGELMWDLYPHDRNMNVMSLENCFCELGKYIKCVNQLDRGEKPNARVAYNGDGKPKKEVKKRVMDPERNIPYIGKKKITQEEYDALEALKVTLKDNKISHNKVYDVTYNLFGEPSIDVPEHTLDWKWSGKGTTETKVYQLLGTNGSGKSTIPKGIVNMDPDAYILSTKMVWLVGNASNGYEAKKGNIEFATVCPNLGVVLVGGYNPKYNIAGCDTLVQATILQSIDLILDISSLRGMSILMEGVVLGKSTWQIEKMRDKENIPLTMLYMDTPLEECYNRLRKRNESQGKEFTKSKTVGGTHFDLEKSYSWCVSGENNRHDVNVQKVDHTLGMKEVVDWFVEKYLEQR